MWADGDEVVALSHHELDWPEEAIPRASEYTLRDSLPDAIEWGGKHLLDKVRRHINARKDCEELRGHALATSPRPGRNYRTEVAIVHDADTCARCAELSWVDCHPRLSWSNGANPWEAAHNPWKAKEPAR
jgi:hypothetical protein